MSTKYFWQNFSDKELLSLKIKDLGLARNPKKLQKFSKKLINELKIKNLNIKPKLYLSNEWFVADGSLGIAIPFVLFHQRLEVLEFNQVGFVEGHTDKEFMMLLRHECGHVIDNAFNLRRNKNRQMVFGCSSAPYKEYYESKEYSRKFVKHLSGGYAQSHPTEDFAETFAEWLTPDSNWKKKYQNWPALKKVSWIDKKMKELSTEKIVIQSKEEIESAYLEEQTLEQYYKKKRRYLRLRKEEFFDKGLKKIFQEKETKNKSIRKNLLAAKYMRSIKSKVIQEVVDQTGAYHYQLKPVIADIIKRCQDLELYVDEGRNQIDQNVLQWIKKESLAYIGKGLTKKSR